MKTCIYAEDCIFEGTNSVEVASYRVKYVEQIKKPTIIYEEKDRYAEILMPEDMKLVRYTGRTGEKVWENDIFRVIVSFPLSLRYLTTINIEWKKPKKKIPALDKTISGAYNVYKVTYKLERINSFDIVRGIPTEIGSIAEDYILVFEDTPYIVFGRNVYRTNNLLVKFGKDPILYKWYKASKPKIIWLDYDVSIKDPLLAPREAIETIDFMPIMPITNDYVAIYPMPGKIKILGRVFECGDKSCRIVQ